MLPSALAGSESHLLPGLPHPASCALRFSQPLDALLPPNPLRVCFTSITLMGFDPSEGFPHRQESASQQLVPLLTFIPKNAPSGVYPPVNPCSHPWSHRGMNGRSSLGILPLQGVLPKDDGPSLSRDLPSCVFPSAWYTMPESTLQGLPSSMDWLVSFENCRPS